MLQLLLLSILLPLASAVKHSKSFLLNEQVSSVPSFSTDQNYVYVPSSGDVVQRDIKSGSVVRTFRGYSQRAEAVILLNETLLVGYSDGLLLQWDLIDGAILRVFDSNCALGDISLFYQYVLVKCSSSSSVMIELTTGDIIATFGLHETFFVYDDVFYGFDVDLSSESTVISYQRNLTKSVVYNGVATALVRRGQFLYVANFPDLKIIEISVLNYEYTVFPSSGQSGIIHLLYLSGMHLISEGSDDKLVLWNISDKSQIKTLSCNSGTVYKILESNSTSFYLLDDIGSISLCNFVDDKRLTIFEGKHVDLSTLVVYNDQVITSSNNVIAKDWSISLKKQIQLLTRPIYSYELFIDFKFLVACNFSSLLLIGLADFTVTKEFGTNEIECGYFYYSNGVVFVSTKLFAINKYNMSNEELLMVFKDEKIVTDVSQMISYTSYLMASFYQFDIYLWNGDTGTFLIKYENFITSAFYIFNSRIYFSDTFRLTLVDPFTFLIASIFKFSEAAYSLLYDNTRNIVFAGFGSGDIFGFDPFNDYAIVYKFQGHTDIVSKLYFKDDFLFSCSYDGTVRQWSLISKRIIYTFLDRDDVVTSVVNIRNNLIVGNIDGDLNEYRLNDTYHIKSLVVCKDGITDITLNDEIVFTSCKDQSISFWNISKEFIVTNKIEVNSVAYALVYSNGFLYSGNDDFSVIRWNITTGKSSRVYKGHDAMINDLIIDGEYLFSAGSDSKICLWELKSGTIIMKFVGHTDQVTTLAMFQRNLFSGSMDKTILVWDILTGVIIKSFKRTITVLGHLGPINQIAFCGSYLFSASSDLTVKQWDPNTGSIVDTLFGHTKQVNCLSCAGKSLISGSDDNSVLLWYPKFLKDVFTSTQSIGKYQTNHLVAQTQNNTTSISFSMIILVMIVGLIFCIGAVILLFKRRHYLIYNNKDSSTKMSSDHEHSVVSTLFTKNSGMAIPAYLEVTIGSFRLLTQIARGGGGTIYITEIFGKEGKFIAKVLKENYGQLNTFMKSGFDQEITLMEFLKPHKNIAKIVGFCREPCCIIMKYYSRGSLQDLIFSDTKLSLKLRLKFIHDIGSGIEYMHSKSILHGDLKPQNVLIDSDEEGMFLVISDFGISQILSLNHLATQSFQIANMRGLSVLYAAPEVFLSYREKAVLRPFRLPGDIYALSIIMFEVLVRMDPYR